MGIQVENTKNWVYCLVRQLRTSVRVVLGSQW